MQLVYPDVQTNVKTKNEKQLKATTEIADRPLTHMLHGEANRHLKEIGFGLHKVGCLGQIFLSCALLWS